MLVGEAQDDRAALGAPESFTQSTDVARASPASSSTAGISGLPKARPCGALAQSWYLRHPTTNGLSNLALQPTSGASPYGPGRTSRRRCTRIGGEVLSAAGLRRALVCAARG